MVYDLYPTRNATHSNAKMAMTAISSCDCDIICPSILWCIMIINKSVEMDKIAIDIWVSWNACRELSTIVPKCAMQTTIAAVAADRMGFWLKRVIWFQRRVARRKLERGKMYMPAKSSELDNMYMRYEHVCYMRPSGAL